MADPRDKPARPAHSMLMRQLRRALGMDSTQELDALLQDIAQSGKRGETAAQGLRALLAMVDDSYQQFDRAQELRLRSLSTSSAELLQANTRLREDAQRQRAIIDQMRTMANRMLAAAKLEPIPADEKSAERLTGVLADLIARSESAHAQLRQSEARYRALTSVSSDWYWEADAGGRFSHLSEGITFLTGLLPEDCLGRAPWDAVGNREDAEPWPEYRQRLAAREPFRDIEVRCELPDENIVYFVLSGEPFYGESGQFAGYRGAARNITPRKRTEQRHIEMLNLTDALIELTPTPISIKDAQLRFLRVNAAFVGMFEIEREQWMGRTARELRGDGAERGETEELAVVRQRKIVQYEMARAMPSGRVVHYIVTKAPLMDAHGGVSSIISTYSDVTDIKTAQRELARELRLTDALIESMPMPVSIKDTQHRFLRINAAYEKMFNVRRQEVLNTTAAEVLMDAARGGHAEEDAMLKSPGVRSYTRSRKVADGSERFFVLTKATTHGEQGEVTGFITTHTDITDLKVAEQRAAQQLQLASTLLETSPTPTVVKDRALITTRCNSAYEQLFEVRREDITGQPMSAYRASYSAQVHAEELELIAKPGMRRDERVLKTPSGKVIPCIVTKSTVLNAAGEVDGLITTVTDITELKRTEEHLIQAKQAAESAMRARAQFLANMSHEIRTPMNGVLGMASVLEQTPLNAEQREFLATIKNSGESLLKIVGDILDFSKIDAGKLDIEETPFHVRSRVTSIAQLFMASARGKQLSLKVQVASDMPSTVLGDPVRVSQALSNLVANAVKFTEKGGVTLIASVASRTADSLMLKFEVRDTGIGISRDAIERIFDPFAQEDASTTRRFGGTGLGLTISRHLAALMGGELSVQSEAGKGSTFSLTVQVRDAGGASTPTPQRATALTPLLSTGPGLAVSLKVLLAEDNHVNQIVARAMLNKLGCTVTVANDGEEVLALTREHEFDVILMDCHMPKLDGYGATAALREREKAAGPGARRQVIIAQTANTLEGDRESCLAAGMDDYIAKPITADVLSEVLQRWKPRRSKTASTDPPP